MTALGRRVRSNMRVRGAEATHPNPALYLILEYPRIVSTCGKRPPIWEWRMAGVAQIGGTA